MTFKFVKGGAGPTPLDVLGKVSTCVLATGCSVVSAKSSSPIKTCICLLACSIVDCRKSKVKAGADE